MIANVIDIETTGLLNFVPDATGRNTLSDDSEIIEVGYITINTVTLEILNHGVLYFYQPYFKIESEAQKIHHITREFLEPYEKDFTKNCMALNTMIQQSYIIGKNSDRFDLIYIDAFLQKHLPECYKMDSIVNGLGINGYNGGKVYYSMRQFSCDVQKVFSASWKDLYAKKYGERPRRAGRLEEYIDAIDGGKDLVDKIYNGFTDKARNTGAHGALYDCCMTLVVYAYSRNSGLGVDFYERQRRD